MVLTMETVIRLCERAGQAEEWALVLAAAGIPSRVEAWGERWTLLVHDDDAPRAFDVLEEFEAEEARRAPIAAPPERPVPWFLGILAGTLLLAAFVVVGSPAGAPRWFERGAALAGAMRAEPWRAVTALTLHLDIAHVAGNAVAIAVLLPAIAQRLGAGIGLLLVLIAGGVGNLLAALAHAPGHAAVGASTATFGAVAMLGALRLFPGPEAPRRWKAWTAPAACLVLLILLGAGPRADVLAHVTGFLSGALAGLAAAPIRRPYGPAIQWTCGLVTIALIAIGWVRALS